MKTETQFDGIVKQLVITGFVKYMTCFYSLSMQTVTKGFLCVCVFKKWRKYLKEKAKSEKRRLPITSIEHAELLAQTRYLVTY